MIKRIVNTLLRRPRKTPTLRFSIPDIGDVFYLPAGLCRDFQNTSLYQKLDKEQDKWPHLHCYVIQNPSWVLSTGFNLSDFLYVLEQHLSEDRIENAITLLKIKDPYHFKPLFMTLCELPIFFSYIGEEMALEHPTHTFSHIKRKTHLVFKKRKRLIDYCIEVYRSRQHSLNIQLDDRGLLRQVFTNLLDIRDENISKTPKLSYKANRHPCHRSSSLPRRERRTQKA